MTKTMTSNLLSIAAVERDTGLGKDTLRVWERRYGFPLPLRNTNGERLYTTEQVARLRLLKRLIDRGNRPSRIMHLDSDQLQQAVLAGGEGRARAVAEPLSSELIGYLELCGLHCTDELRRALGQAMMRAGLRNFILDTVGPLTRAVGDYWEQGRFEVFEEHLYSEVIQNVLRVGIASIPRDEARARPRILLTTFPQEQHGLGLLMAEAIFALEGAQCLSLGVQTPVGDIANAARHADVVALSFSSGLHGNQVLDGLAELAAALPESTEIWGGGESAALARCALPNFHRVDLVSAAARVAVWRSSRLAAGSEQRV